MKHLVLFAAAMAMAETAAVACSCSTPDDPAQLQRYATDVGKRAAALVEAETLTSFEDTRQGERMKLVRTLAGDAPDEFRIERSADASSDLCDVLYRVGERPILILFPATTSQAGLPVYRVAGMCTAWLVHEPVFRDSLIRALNARGERG